ncbi:MAG: pirin family protein [Cyclobacteriaceae bacterium]
METIVHKAETRGHVNFGWLDSNHSFSFGHYHNPDRMQFGALRVLNDDVVQGGAGFPTHPHDNMEIISIPLSGALAHRDSTGTEKAIRTGEVQIMSAGSGLTHSEYNYNKEDDVNFLQIWILPKKSNIVPRYDQRVFNSLERRNKFQTVVAPDNNNALWINQDAWLSLADFDANTSTIYNIHREGNGAYIFVLEGSVTIGGQELTKRDAIGIHDASSIELVANSDSKLLVIDIPLATDTQS